MSLGLLLALFYLIIRYGFTAQLESYGPYTSYIFEIICVAIGAFLHREHLRKIWTVNRKIIGSALVCGTLGFTSFKVSGFLGIVVPFNLEGTETLIFLLIVAPVLEELIFHGLLWFPLARINTFLALLVTSILFSLSHFSAYFYTPAEYHSFIFYQTGYTLVLGLACGLSVWRWNSLAGAILIHFCFNLGFFLAY